VPPKPRILSGVQPSGKLHIGNYFGAIRQHIALQDQGEAFYFIADYHALTTLAEAEAKEADEAKKQGRKARPAREILRDNVRDVALDYLALGLDPAKAAFYRQSDLPEVTELAWFLASVTGMGLLERAHSYKDKVARGITPGVGLFTYPVLMAADILIVRSNLVPVGKDQVQHLEMTQDMAGKFNRAFGDIFPIPNPRLDKESKVPGTDGQKMSKSYGNTIDIFAEGKPLEKTVMGIKTDSTPLGQPLDPDKCNVFALHSLFASDEEKAALKAKIDTYFGPFREKRKQLASQAGYVEDVLRDGAQRARAEAQQTMALVREAVGI
jgi:tryptophanyl-tRNA synthetase